MPKFLQFHNQLTKTTKEMATVCAKCCLENDQRLMICGRLYRALLADMAKAKTYAETVAYEARRAEQDAEKEGRTEHAHVGAAARLLAYVWMDVATLGTENLTRASKMLEMAIEHLKSGKEELAGESCRTR